MAAMDARRLELYELLKPKIDEEPAKALVLALPSDPDRLVTKDDLNGALISFEERLATRFAQLESTLTRRMISVMGAWTVLVGSTVGWVAAVLR